MTKGTVNSVISNMVTLRVDGPVKQGEICYIETGGDKLMSEVIKIIGADVYVQVFESTRGLKVGAPAEFTGHMLEVQLAPGMLSKEFDGLQNDLNKMEGVFLKRGQYTDPLDRDREWDFIPIAKEGDVVQSSDWLGQVDENTQPIKIMVPFQMEGKAKVKSIVKAGKYKVEDTIAVLVTENQEEIKVNMIQHPVAAKGLAHSPDRQDIPCSLFSHVCFRLLFYCLSDYTRKTGHQERGNPDAPSS